MLGTGASVTQAAMREFARAGVLVGFCGGGGTPLYASNDVDVADSSHVSTFLYGKTRRGGLVFDAADMIKDALKLPQAFISAMAGDDEQEFRQRYLNSFQRAKSLDVIIDVLQATTKQLSQVAR